jgi:hypothetical protein
MSRFEAILERLEQYRQRARFRAVGGLLGLNPNRMFRGYPRDSRTCWVVAKDTGLPTGFARAKCHPDLTSNPHVIETSIELRQWLANNP